MYPSSVVLLAALAGVGRSSQPGAAKPVAAPMRDLVWGQLNFLHTTDTHGWLGGHLLEPQYSGDWGDYVSFAEHMRKKADDSRVDLLLVDTGDRVEGNGLYDASSPKGIFTNDILREQDIDILCTGNHELYQASTAQREHEQTVPMFRDSYIASNLDYVDPASGKRVPQAPQRYKRFKTKNLGIDIVAFGFLFDFTGNANNTVVQPVEDTLKEEWFKKAISVRDKPDLYIVIGHVGLRMPEFKAIYTEIRKSDWDTPIAFFGGHAHVRDALKFDKNAFAMASGRYLETVGWMSIDGIKEEPATARKDVQFSRRYIDNNLFGYYYHTGLNASTFPTTKGKRVRDIITRSRKALDLDYSFGCAPKDLWMSRAPYPNNASIFTWLETEVLPDIAVAKGREEVPRLAIFNTGGIRFDIFAGAFTRDSTYIVSPFISEFRHIPDVPYSVAKKVLDFLNGAGQIFESAGLDNRFLTIPQQMFPKLPVAQGEGLDSEMHLELRSVGDQAPLDGGHGETDKPTLIAGYTTSDDIGDSGDDTVHSALEFYDVPNCIQATIAFPEKGEPEKVDLVFLDFVQPWVIVALKFSGGEYSDHDVQQYRDGTFTFHMAEWIRKNWKGSC